MTFCQEIITLPRPIHRGVWNLTHKFHLYFILVAYIYKQFNPFLNENSILDHTQLHHHISCFVLQNLWVFCVFIWNYVILHLTSHYYMQMAELNLTMMFSLSRTQQPEITPNNTRQYNGGKTTILYLKNVGLRIIP